MSLKDNRRSLLISAADHHGDVEERQGWLLDPDLQSIRGGNLSDDDDDSLLDPSVHSIQNYSYHSIKSHHSSKAGIDAPEGKRSISALRLAMITYFFTSGGPTGSEPAVGAAGPLYSLIAFFVVPLLWCVPQALMSAELSLMMEQNGGNLLWVRKAFGDFVGWFNAFNFLTYAMASMSIALVLFTNYLPDSVQHELEWWQTVLMQLGFCLLLTGLNLWGVTWVSRLSFVFFVVIYSPFIVETVAAPLTVDMDWKSGWKAEPFGSIQWTLFLSTVLWCYGAFDAIGSVAGEVKGGRNTFIRGIAYSLPVVTFNYFLPIVIGYAIVPDRNQWQSGFFTQVAYRVSNWLGIWLVVASQLSNFAGYNAGMVSTARVVWACGRGPVETRLLPSFVSWSMRSKTGTVRPVMAILVTAAITFAMSLLPFNVLVQFTMAVRVINLFCEYGALIKLKFSEPDAPRPFSVPGGIVGAIIISLPTLVLSVLLLAFADWELWAFTGGLNAVFLVGYGVRWVFMRLCCPTSQQQPATTAAV